MTPIETGRLVLRPIRRSVARVLLDGGIPRELRFARGYPSQLSFDVMAQVLDTTEPGRFGPYFITRRCDGVIIGEIGCRTDTVPGNGRVSYTVVEPCWGQGYATEALRALLARVLTEPDMSRVVAEAMTGNVASRRVMEKAGMRYCGQRGGDEYGGSRDVVVYEVVALEEDGSLTR